MRRTSNTGEGWLATVTAMHGPRTQMSQALLITAYNVY